MSSVVFFIGIVLAVASLQHPRIIKNNSCQRIFHEGYKPISL